MNVLKSCKIALKNSLSPSSFSRHHTTPRLDHRETGHYSFLPGYCDGEGDNNKDAPLPSSQGGSAAPSRCSLKNAQVKIENEVHGGGKNVSQCSLERRNEEHRALVAAQMFDAWTGEHDGDSSRRTFQDALTVAMQDGTEATSLCVNLSSKAKKDLDQLARQLGLSQKVEQLVWWLVSSHQTVVDPSWSLSQLQVVQSALGDASYTEEEKAKLLHSFTLFIHTQLKRLRTLHTAFPDPSHDRQLISTLRCLWRLESHPSSRRLLDQAGQPPIVEDVTAALQRHAHDWWRDVVGPYDQVEERRGRRVVEGRRVEKVVALLPSLPPSLHTLVSRFQHVFLEEVNINYAAISHAELGRQLAQLTRTLLSSQAHTRQEHSKKQVKCPTLENFSVDSPLWCLYKNLGHVYSLGEEWRDGTDSFRPPDYPACFMANVGGWLTHLHAHTLHLLHHPRPAPHTSPHSPPCPPPLTPPHSDSLYELIYAFKEIGCWWREVDWPEDETCGVVLVLLLQHLLSLAAALAHAASRDLTVTPPPSESDSASIISSTDSEESYTSRRRSSCLTPSTYFDDKLYRCLLILWWTEQAVDQLTGILDVSGLVERLKEAGRDVPAKQLETTVVSLLASVSQNLETLVGQVTSSAVDKVRARVREEVEAACSGGGKSNNPLVLYLSLHNTLIRLQDHLQLPSSSVVASLFASSSPSSAPKHRDSTSSCKVHSDSKTSQPSSAPSKITSCALSSEASPSSPLRKTSLPVFSFCSVLPASFSNKATYSTQAQSHKSASKTSLSSFETAPSHISSKPASVSSHNFSLATSSVSARSSTSSFNTSPPSPTTKVPFTSNSSSAPSSPYHRLLQQLWDAIVAEFMVLVADGTGRRPPEYFSTVEEVLDSAFTLLTRPGHLHPAAASTPGYRSVAEAAGGQRVGTVALISRYYQERYRQQVTVSLHVTAYVLVRAFFSQPGHLTVRVLEARGMNNECGHEQGCRREQGCGYEEECARLQGCVRTQGCGHVQDYGRVHGCGRMVQGCGRGTSRCSSRYQVTVQVVPREVFPGASLCRTSPSTLCPPSFNETFEFPTGEGGVEGYLEVCLLVTGGGGGGLVGVIGEAFLPLPSLPYIDSPTLQNTHLPMALPAFTPGYEALSALRARVWDDQAISFLRHLHRRHPESRHST